MTLLVLVGTLALRRFHDLLPLDRTLVIGAALPVITTLLSAFGSSEARGPATLEVCRVAYSMALIVLVAHLRLAAGQILSTARAWTLTTIATCGVAIVGVSGVLLLGWPRGWWARPSAALAPSLVRASGLLAANALVLYLVPGLAFALLCLRNASRRSARLGYSVAVVVILVSAALAFSRGLMGVAIGLWLCASAKDLPELHSLRRWVGALAVTASLLAFATGVWQLVPVGGELTVDTRHASYFVFHRAGLRMFLAHPLLGVGPERFGHELPLFTNADELSSSSPPLRAQPNYDPHSFWVARAAETGLFGLAAWSGLFYIVFKRLSVDPWCAFSSPVSLLPRFMRGATVGILANGFHLDFAHLKFVWVALGLAIAAARHEARQEQARATGRTTPPSGQPVSAGGPPISSAER